MMDANVHHPCVSSSSALAKVHPDNLFVDKGVFSDELLKERETQIILSRADSPDPGSGIISTDDSR